MAHQPPSDVVRVWLSIGANLGDRAGAIRRGLEAIDRLPETRLTNVSSLYATEPIGVTDQPEFLNCAAGCDTKLSPIRLLEGLREIEQRLGRLSRQRWHEREIDIDILLYGDLTLTRENLTIPHPEMHRRRFVLVPLEEIAPHAQHPILHRSVTQLLVQLEDRADVRRLDEPTFPLLSTYQNQDIA